MKAILEKHLDSEIGVNIDHPTQIDTLQLTTVEDDWFTVMRTSDGNVYHVPFANVSKIIEHSGGVTVGGLFRQTRTYAVVVKIGHVVDYVAS